MEDSVFLLRSNTIGLSPHSTALRNPPALRASVDTQKALITILAGNTAEITSQIRYPAGETEKNHMLFRLPVFPFLLLSETR